KFSDWLAPAPQLRVQLIEMPRQLPQRIARAGGLGFGRKHLYHAEFHLDIILAEGFVKKQVPNLAHVGIALRIAWKEKVEANIVLSPQEAVLDLFGVDSMVPKLDDVSDRPARAKSRYLPLLEFWCCGCQRLNCREGALYSGCANDKFAGIIFRWPKLE